MKTAADVIRAKVLLQTMTDAKEWRETVEEHPGEGYGNVTFEEFSMSDDPEFMESYGFEGSFRMPRDVAIAMFNWLEAHARAELEKIGVKV